MSTAQKILVAGVGGQGIVYLTGIIVEAAMRGEVPVHVSEIHGLSQRGGTVTSGIGLGAHRTGYIGRASVDLLIGLEIMETQRCLPWLHKGSRVVFGADRIIPNAVNAGAARYPDARALAAYLRGQCAEVACVEDFPEDLASVMHNLYLLGVASTMEGFPFAMAVLEDAARGVVSPRQVASAIAALHAGSEHHARVNAASAQRTSTHG